MKRIALAAAILLPLAAFAQTTLIQDTTEFARVLNYSPIQGPQTARRVCAPVSVTQASGSNPGAAVAGGLVGALVGSRFGGGNGKAGTTIAGAIGGAMLGDALGSGPSTTTQQQCNTVYEQGQPAGYEVTYEYKGKLLTATTRMPPGEYLKVHSRVTLE